MNLRAEALGRFRQAVEPVFAACQRWGLTPLVMYVDHNLLIDVFGNAEARQAYGLPVKALPLEYGWDHLVRVECDREHSVTLDASGRIERLA